MKEIILALLLLLAFPLQAQQVEVRGARIWTAPDQTRLVVDAAAAVSHKIFRLDNPHRLVIDVPDARLKGKLPTVEADEPLLIGLRSGVREGNDLRIVLDLKQPVRAKSFLLQPNDKYRHRLVVDLTPTGQTVAGTAKGSGSKAPVQKTPRKAREVVVAIDAGHGGEDPGAIGAKGTREKKVTLAIARKLARLLDKQRGMRPVLIRDGDYYVRLRKRIQLAREHKADLFVSIHADAFRDRRVRGSSVYTISHRGASSEAAKWLADKENSADLIGGIDHSENDGLLGKVLLEMTQNATVEHSRVAAGKVLSHLKGIGPVHKRSVQKAGFVVLKAPDIPSMLVETAYISNREEEQRLRSTAHQEELAKAIMGGIKAYFASYPPPGTLLADSGESRRHVITNGDTLSEIAKRYAISLNTLRSANSIDGDSIRIGQVLTIPGS